MSNLLNNQFHNLKLKIDESEYWDFFINRDARVKEYINLGDRLMENCLSVFIDASDKNCIFDKGVCSKDEIGWEDSIVNYYTLYNIGYTGVDNGLIPFKRDEVDNKEFLEIYQNSTHDIGIDSKLRLYKIDGSTKKYEYPISVEENKIKLNGGFYQGAFMTECNKYQILPNKLDKGDVWNLEFVLSKENFREESKKTLNDKYPNNKGIFFYIGTRAENKWVFLYDENKTTEEILFSYFTDYIDDSDIDNPSLKGTMLYIPIDTEELFMDDYITSLHYDNNLYKNEEIGLEDFFYAKEKAKTIDEDNKSEEIVFCNYVHNGDKFDLVADFDKINHDDEYIEPELEIEDFKYETKDGFLLKVSNQWYFETDNKFLMFDRTCNGFTTKNYHEGDRIRYVGVKNNFKENLFLVMNRTCTGMTTNDIEKVRNESVIKYDVLKDLYNNALAFRITDDGRVGYRYLVQDCENDLGYRILEGYSCEGIVKENEITIINVRIKGFYKTMVLEFYVNGKLKFITKEMPKLNLRKLDDLYEKQELVPYNISLGGGSQGLIETVLPDYMHTPTEIYPIEENFAGTFIGYLYAFRFYTCNLNFFEIINNYQYEIKHNKYL